MATTSPTHTPTGAEYLTGMLLSPYLGERLVSFPATGIACLYNGHTYRSVDQRAVPGILARELQRSLAA